MDMRLEIVDNIDVFSVDRSHTNIIEVYESWTYNKISIVFMSKSEINRNKGKPWDATEISERYDIKYRLIDIIAHRFPT